jgi:polyhydroxyalkanoate synthesis regulator phasin
LKRINRKMVAGVLAGSVLLGAAGVAGILPAKAFAATTDDTGVAPQGQGKMQGRGGSGQSEIVNEVAALLSIDVNALTTALAEGKTMVEIAAPYGINEDSLVSSLVTSVTASIEAKVTAGTLTQDQATQQLDGLKDRLTKQVEGKMGGAGQGQGARGVGTGGGQSGTDPNTSTNAGTGITLVDISGHWAQKSIESLVSKGILTGDQNKKFNPNGTVTREEVATMITKGFNLTTPASSTATFSDVDSSRWSYSYIETTKDYFTVSGKFEPTNKETRTDVLVTLMKAYLGSNPSVALLSNDEADSLLASKFKDSTSIAQADRPYLATAVQLGIVKGDNAGKFNPGKTVSRAEIATMLDAILALADSGK